MLHKKKQRTGTINFAFDYACLAFPATICTYSSLLRLSLGSIKCSRQSTTMLGDSAAYPCLYLYRISVTAEACVCNTLAISLLVVGKSLGLSFLYDITQALAALPSHFIPQSPSADQCRGLLGTKLYPENNST